MIFATLQTPNSYSSWDSLSSCKLVSSILIGWRMEGPIFLITPAERIQCAGSNIPACQVCLEINWLSSCRNPGLYYFQTEGPENGEMQLCIVHVKATQRHHYIEVTDRRFNPRLLNVSQGDRVWWLWDRFKVSAPSWDSFQQTVLSLRAFYGVHIFTVCTFSRYAKFYGMQITRKGGT